MNLNTKKYKYKYKYKYKKIQIKFKKITLCKNNTSQERFYHKKQLL